ncbi:MAG: hypothetical protein JNJ45_02220 [Chthonomonas sp.]|nr:hypothetical protein [Chthonomonas sp.]
MLAIAISAFVLVQTPNYGLTPAQASGMSVDGYLAHAEKVRKVAMPEYEVRAALYTFSLAIDGRNAATMARLSSTSRGQLSGLQKSLDQFLINLNGYETMAAGGGTMYLTFHAFRYAEARVLMRDLLEGKLKDPGSRVVSDGTNAILKVVGPALAGKSDQEMGQDPKAVKASAEALVSSYKAVCESLKSRPRAQSNAVIQFCMDKVKAEIGEK